jgi:RNA polymerase sigma-70 factor (ECF subfamily)
VDIDALFQRLYPALFRYVHRMTGDADAAEDIAQESFVRLLRQTLPEEEARPWLFAVATNLLRDRARKIERRQRLLTTTPIMPASASAPDEDTERSEQIALVRKVLARIPPRDRQLLLMREEGFKYEEMARALGVASSSVGTLIARALRRFTEAYKAQEAGE